MQANAVVCGAMSLSDNLDQPPTIDTTSLLFVGRIFFWHCLFLRTSRIKARPECRFDIVFGRSISVIPRPSKITAYKASPFFLTVAKKIWLISVASPANLKVLIPEGVYY